VTDPARLAAGRELLAQVQANAARLRDCPRHTFERLPGSQPLRHRYRCTNCEGEVDGHAHFWYEIGREHGKKEAA
jgi:hypothetical protein